MENQPQTKTVDIYQDAFAKDLETKSAEEIVVLCRNLSISLRLLGLDVKPSDAITIKNICSIISEKNNDANISDLAKCIEASHAIFDNANIRYSQEISPNQEEELI